MVLIVHNATECRTLKIRRDGWSREAARRKADTATVLSNGNRCRGGRRARACRGRACSPSRTTQNARKEVDVLVRVGLLLKILLVRNVQLFLCNLLLQAACVEQSCIARQCRVLASERKIARDVARIERVLCIGFGGLKAHTLLGVKLALRALEALIVEASDSRGFIKRLLTRELGLKDGRAVPPECALRSRIALKGRLLLLVHVLELSFRGVHHVLRVRIHVLVD